MYNQIDEAFLAGLREIVGAEHVFTDEATLDRYKTDEESDPAKFHLPDAVVAPGNTEEVAAIVRLANEANIPVTVRAAGTSIACGAIAVCGGLLLLMERMNRILEINADAMYMVVEAGALTKEIQEEAQKVNLLYAGDPCSADSCTIGGNIATNAGGNRAIRYGVTRNQIYAIEVVTPTGKIVNLGARLKKSSTGYCLEQLVMGSEGTLGIITKATLKLQPLPPYKFDILAVFDDIDKAAEIVPKIIKAGINPTSIEFMDNDFVRSTSEYCELPSAPHKEDGNYVLITVETFDENQLDMAMETLAELCEENGAIDVLEADERIWNMRRNCQESLRLISPVSITDDMVVPQDKVAESIKYMKHLSGKYSFDIRVIAHAGDGNLHVCMCRNDLPEDVWNREVADFHKEAYKHIYAIGGRLSGEHGIGAKKLPDMEIYTPEAELEMMKAIKKALDPKTILNPGKIFNM